MKNSSSPSDSLQFALTLALLLVGGSTLHWVVLGWSWLPLVWLVPALVCLVLWMRNDLGKQRFLKDIQDMAQDVARGKFARRIKNIPTTGQFHALCWDMNDMLDQLEACFREQATALQYASVGRYYRLAQPVGLRGSFHESLQGANESLKTIEQKTRQEEKAAADKLVAQAQEQRIASENLRIRNALDKCTTNVMIADVDLNIIYMNETVTAMMQRNEAELRKVLPQFD
ncbi:MAG: hypothetical protein Q7J75_02905, partial [Rhodoferax sp.]|nr:hypothetical protein [Rhodoferax sp.]